MEYMHKMTKCVETKLSNILHESVVLEVDGWWANDTYFVAIFATFTSYQKCGYEMFY